MLQPGQSARLSKAAFPMSSHLGSGASAVHGGAFARTVGFCDPCAMQQKKKQKAGVGGGGGEQQTREYASLSIDSVLQI